MAVPAEEAVLNALRGHLSENIKLPAPLIIKVYVASLKKGLYTVCIYYHYIPTIIQYHNFISLHTLGKYRHCHTLSVSISHTVLCE